MHFLDPILESTAAIFQCTTAELVGRSRKRPIVDARHAAMWAIRQRYPSISLEGIGSTIGGRHYTTVMHALVSVEERAQRNAGYHMQLQHVLARVARSPSTYIPALAGLHDRTVEGRRHGA
ncbi:MAG: helix-turn-helix domain-containing protein [Roseiflexaceae bacterium]